MVSRFRAAPAKDTDLTTKTSGEIAAAVCASIAARQTHDEPYRWWLVKDMLPANVTQELARLEFSAPSLAGLSGRRELHNDSRSYFDAAGMQRFPVMRAIAEALQSGPVTQAIHQAFGAPIDDTYLRLEYALDIDGFWLEPHTDLGVKKFTCLLYLSEAHEQLGTDIYRAKDEHFGRTPFAPGSAMIFVPSDKTWHGFVKRPIKGVRRSMILNYVTRDWLARDQLSFPDTTVRL